MAWHYSTEATANAARTRQAPPSARALAGAVRYRGCYLFPRKVKGGDLWSVWEATGAYGPRWLAPCHSLREAMAVVDALRGVETGGAA